MPHYYFSWMWESGRKGGFLNMPFTFVDCKILSNENGTTLIQWLEKVFDIMYFNLTFFRKSSTRKSIRCKSAPNRVSSFFSVWNCYKFNYLLPIFTGKVASFFLVVVAILLWTYFLLLATVLRLKFKKWWKNHHFMHLTKIMWLFISSSPYYKCKKITQCYENGC